MANPVSRALPSQDVPNAAAPQPLAENGVSTPNVLPAGTLVAIAELVAKDCRQDAGEFLGETIVPFGGE